MNKRRINVLFTAVCGWPTHATVNSLRKSKKYDYFIVGVDSNPNPFALNYCDVLLKVPKTSESNYVDELLRIAKKYKIEIVVPLISEEIEPLYLRLDDFEKNNIKVLLSNKDSMLLVANDKYKLQKFLEETYPDKRIMPRTIKANKGTSKEDLIAFGYPKKSIVLKLKDGCGGVGFKILNEEKANGLSKLNSRETRVNPYINFEQFNELIQNERYLIQEYLSGNEFGVLSLVDNGRTIYTICHENYDMQYATTTDCEIVKNEKIEKLVEDINFLLKLDGNIGYDFKRDEDGNILLLEINPRISATVNLAVEGGVNIVEMGILHKLGLPIEENLNILYGLRMKRVYGTLFTLNGEPYHV